jgi:cephalosporin hydroxylase
MRSLCDDMMAHTRRRTLFGRRIAQSRAALHVMDRLLYDYAPTLIIELGTSSGTLTALFSTYAVMSDRDVRVVSYDLVETPGLADKIRTLSGGRADVVVRDVKDEGCVSDVTGIINAAERPFLMVDAADPKLKDAERYGAKLKRGVPVFVHDAILKGAKPFGWGFHERETNMDIFHRLEPYYMMSVEGDTRTLCLATNGKG